MSKALKSLIFLLSIIYTISIEEKFIDRNKPFRPFVSVPSVDSLHKMVNQMKVDDEEDISFLAEENPIISSKTVRCFYLDEYNVFDISGLCTKETSDNKEVARQYTLQVGGADKNDTKSYTIYTNFCRNLKGTDTCNSDKKKAQAYIKEKKGPCNILAGDIGEGNKWNVINKINSTDVDHIEIKVKHEGNNELTYELYCDDSDSMKDYEKEHGPKFLEQNSSIIGNESYGFKVKLSFNSYGACVKINFYFIWKFIEDYKVMFIIGLIAFGLFNCIFGKKLAKYNAFILCVVIITILVLVFSQYVLPSGCAEWIIWVMLAVGILLGGTAGYFAFVYNEKIMAILAGGISGFFIGQFLYNLFGNRIEFNGIVINVIFVAAAIAVMILMAFCFKKMIIIVATSIIGAYIFIRGISLFGGGFPSEIQIMDLNREGESEQLKNLLTWQVYVYLSAMVVVAGLSIFAQYKFNKDDDEEEEDKDDKKDKKRRRRGNSDSKDDNLKATEE